MKLAKFLLWPVLMSGTTFSATGPEKAYELVRSGDAVIVDVRELDEIAHGMIKDSLWFPKSKMTTDKESLDAFLKLTRGKKVFLYCRSGKRSEECEDLLEARGVSAESLGGFEDLRSELPTETLHEKINRLKSPEKK